MGGKCRGNRIVITGGDMSKIFDQGGVNQPVVASTPLRENTANKSFRLSTRHLNNRQMVVVGSYDKAHQNNQERNRALVVSLANNEDPARRIYIFEDLLKAIAKKSRDALDRECASPLRRQRTLKGIVNNMLAQGKEEMGGGEGGKDGVRGGDAADGGTGEGKVGFAGMSSILKRGIDRVRPPPVAVDKVSGLNGEGTQRSALLNFLNNEEFSGPLPKLPSSPLLSPTTARTRTNRPPKSGVTIGEAQGFTGEYLNISSLLSKAKVEVRDSPYHLDRIIRLEGEIGEIKRLLSGGCTGDQLARFVQKQRKVNGGSQSTSSFGFKSSPISGIKLDEISLDKVLSLGAKRELQGALREAIGRVERELDKILHVHRKHKAREAEEKAAGEFRPPQDPRETSISKQLISISKKGQIAEGSCTETTLQSIWSKTTKKGSTALNPSNNTHTTTTNTWYLPLPPSGRPATPSKPPRPLADREDIKRIFTMRVTEKDKDVCLRRRVWAQIREKSGGMGDNK